MAARFPRLTTARAVVRVASYAVQLLIVHSNARASVCSIQHVFAVLQLDIPKASALLPLQRLTFLSLSNRKLGLGPDSELQLPPSLKHLAMRNCL